MTKCPTCGTEFPDIPDDVGIDPSRFEVHASGKILRLSPREFSIFSMLYHKLGLTISKEVLIKRLHKLKLHHAPPSRKTMDVWISILRKKIRPLGFRIETRWGLGVALLREPRKAVPAEPVKHRKMHS
jgi:DNA-binding response OmpR family regulator